MSIDPAVPRPPSRSSPDADAGVAVDSPSPAAPSPPGAPKAKAVEIGGPPGPEPTRYGDWQFNGRVTDF